MVGYIVLSVCLTLAMVCLCMAPFWLSLKKKLTASNRRLQNAEENLERTRNEIQKQREAIFNAMGEGVLLCDSSTRILFANNVFKRIFGVSDHLPQNPTLLEVIRFNEIRDVFYRTLKNGRTMGVELDMPGLKSSSLLLNAVVIRDEQGKSDHVLLSFYDFTRLKELENARRDFVANVSHELRTPLSMIKGFVETIIDNPSIDRETLSHFLGKVQKHSDRLSLLIEDLLTVSKLESSQSTVILHEVDLHKESNRVLSDLKSNAEKKNIQLHLDIPEEMKVMADEDLLEQIFLNLLDNAVKYGNSGGNVWVRAAKQSHQQICVSVHDDGPGIPQEATERIFERFYRVDKARSRAQGGTGLGLSIVKHIAHTLGGRVWVESKTGKGSSFFFTLQQSVTE